MSQRKRETIGSAAMIALRCSLCSPERDMDKRVLIFAIVSFAIGAILAKFGLANLRG